MELLLSDGNKALIDDEDFDLINQHSWITHHSGYIISTIKNKKTLLHRFILKLIDPSCEVDHINNIKNDCRKINLRICNRKQNTKNRSKTTSLVTSLYKGVCWNSKNNNWRSRITNDSEGINLGSFKIEEDAACAYDMAALHYFGEFAHTNFDRDSYSQQEIKNFIFKLENKKKSSKYKGVYLNKKTKTYMSQIYVSNIKIHLGYFNTEEEAAKAYDKKAIELRGNKAKLNFPHEVQECLNL